MSVKLILTTTIAYGEVDRDEVLTLSGLFKHLQEAAITHANQFDAGTIAMAERGESWVLNRMKVAIARYPKYNDSVRMETWSRGIVGFRGYREYRVYENDELLISASALWLYVNVRTRSLQRVPQTIADSFPCHTAEIFSPDLDHIEVSSPALDARKSFPLSVRYSDIDANDHVNNTAYLEFVQTALAKAGLSPRPREIMVKFSKAIPADTHEINVHLEPRAASTIFSISAAQILCAEGSVIT